MERIDILSRRVISYYAEHSIDIHDDIQHTQEVASYTQLIAMGEKMSAYGVEMQIAAAWLHDIGCPRSKEIYGNSLPQNQQRVGRVVASELLNQLAALFNDEEKEWLVEVVGRHHQAGDVERYNFRPLFEADLIVNLLSGYHPREKSRLLFDSLMSSSTGCELFNEIIK